MQSVLLHTLCPVPFALTTLNHGISLIRHTLTIGMDSASQQQVLGEEEEALVNVTDSEEEKVKEERGEDD